MPEKEEVRIKRINLVYPKRTVLISLTPRFEPALCSRCKAAQTLMLADDGLSRCLQCSLTATAGGRMTSTKIGELLRRKGILDVEKISKVLDKQRSGQSRQLFGEIAVEEKYCTSKQISEVIGEAYYCEYIPQNKVDQVAIKLISKDLCAEHKVFCFERENQRFLIGMVNPFDETALLSVCRAINREVVNITTFISTPEDFQLVMEHHDESKAIELKTKALELRRPEPELTAAVDFGEKEIEIEEQGNLRILSEDEETAIPAEAQKDITRQVGRIIREGIKHGASDIHLEFTEKNFLVQYRVDSDMTVPIYMVKKLGRYIINKIRNEAGIHINSQKDKRADGKLSINYDGKKYNMRVGLMPTIHGPMITIRILDRTSLFRDLRELGLSQRSFQLLTQAAFEYPNGLVMVTGPTASGKTTTLYTLISKLAETREHKIISLEDPVEYEIPGVNQIQVDANLRHRTYRALLPGILRMDPDICLIGETRDRVSAENVYTLSLYGKLVFTSLHANDSISAINRLINLRIEPYQIAATTRLVLSQRLVKMLCPSCKTSRRIAAEELTSMGLNYEFGYPAEINEPRKGGCSFCRNKGYKGRTTITEALEMTNHLEDLIIKKADKKQLLLQAMKDGMVTLKSEGLEKILSGITSISEVLRVTGKRQDPALTYKGKVIPENSLIQNFELVK